MREVFRVCLARGLNELPILYNKMLQYLQILTKYSKNCLEKRKNILAKGRQPVERNVYVLAVFHQYIFNKWPFCE
jgi:hypothetical protein